jgi:putative ABC transport system permease protein
MTPSFRGLWIRLRYYLFRERYDREMEEEMRFHLELRAAAHEHDGLSEAEARDLARRRFGNTTALQEHRRMAVGLPSLETLGQDLRDVLRAIRHAPGFSVMVVATLGIAIGANAAMFGIIDRLMLRGPAYVVDADRVVRLYSTERFDRTQFTSSVVGFVTYDHLRRSARDFEDLAVYTQTDATAGAGQNASRISLGRASWNFFPLLGVRPVLGRFFTAEEDRPPRGENVIVLDEGYWRRAFGGDRKVIGRTMAIGGVTYTIVGVAPRGFTGAELERRDGWVPISLPYWGPGDDWPTTWTSSWLQIVGRLKPGVSFAQAGIDATDAHRRAFDGPPDNTMRTATLSVAPLRFTRVGKENVVTRVSRWLVAVATIVLLVACANVANLFLARATRRRREVAVRLALGISRGRLIRLLVGESVVLGLLGGIAGLAVAYVGGKFVRGVLLPNVAWTDAPIDVRVLAVTALMAFAVGLVVGLAPALQGTRLELTSALKSGVREGGAGRSRVRAMLTVTQAALSVVLLVGAGLFVMSLWKINALHLGIEPEKLMTVSFDWPSLAALPADVQHRERLRRNLFYQEALRRVRALPGVAHAAVGVGTPFQSSASLDHLRVAGRDSIPRLGGEDPTIRAVSDDYFATAGTRVLRGRVFTAADVAGAERVVVVNETMARLVWPKGDAIGACLLMDSLPCSRVIGVVEDTRKFALKEDPVMQYYIPLGEERELGFGGPQMFVRPAAAVAGLREQLRSELTRLDPTISFVTVGMLQDLLDPQIRPWRLGATMFGIFGALALLVAAIGLYSVISYLVAQRAHELGVRIALGAQVGNIVSLVMRHGVGMALVGVGIGTVLALNGARWIGPLLFDTSPRNPVIFGVVAVVLLLVALLASVVPAWRASRVDPIEALRAD